MTHPGLQFSGEKSSGEEPFLSVLVRTQGSRMDNLMEALTCLASQTDDDFHVHLMVHSSRTECFDGARRLVARFARDVASRVSVHQVAGGGRATPLNVGLSVASARYIAFLDDDDLVTADWVEQFRRGANHRAGVVIRSVAVDRRVARHGDERLMGPYHTVSGLVATHNPTFNALEHLSVNRTPICSFAVPMEAVRSLGARFDESLPVLEDWRFLLDVALRCGVHDTGIVTSVYQRWEGGDSRAGAMAMDAWKAAHRSIMEDLDSRPLLLPAGSASQIALLWERQVPVDDGAGPHSHEDEELNPRPARRSGSLLRRALTYPLRRSDQR